MSMEYGTPKENEASAIIDQAYNDYRNGVIDHPGKSPALVVLLDQIKKDESTGGGAARYGFEVRGLLREAGVIE